MRFSPKILLFLAFLLAAALFLGYTLITPGWKPVVISVYSDPEISVENRVKDVGVVETDRKVHTSFLLYNTGGKHLRLHRVEASCGCTVADISKNVIAPGDFTRIRVVMDTSLKLGGIRKKLTLYSNDPDRPVLNLFITGKAVPGKMRGHEPISLVPRDRLTLFKGECAACHVNKGIGKTGKALFQADCAMCHGQNAQGHLPSGPSLLGGNADSDAWESHLRRVIAEGSPSSPQMPPFAKEKGGPLTSDQIDSLVSFLKFHTAQTQSGASPSSETENADAEEEDAGDVAAFEEALRQPH